MLMKDTLFEEYLALEMASGCFYLLIENVLFFSNNRILRNCFKKVTSIYWSRNFIHFYKLDAIMLTFIEFWIISVFFFFFDRINSLKVNQKGKLFLLITPFIFK